MKNQIKYIADIQPPYGISRYKYYEVTKENSKYCIIGDYNNEVYYNEQELKKLYSSDNWDEICIKEKKIKNNVTSKDFQLEENNENE